MTAIKAFRAHLATAAATAALLLGTAGLASAEDDPTIPDDSVAPTTGQTLTIRADPNEGTYDFESDTTTMTGLVTITPGSATITSVVVEINGQEAVAADVDDQGRFEASGPLADDSHQINVMATATASDGTYAFNGFTITEDGWAIPSVGSPDPTPPGVDNPPVVDYATLPNTGPSGPRTLGPIGLAMMLLGSTLVWRNRRYSQGA